MSDAWDRIIKWKGKDQPRTTCGLTLSAPSLAPTRRGGPHPADDLDALHDFLMFRRN